MIFNHESKPYVKLGRNKIRQGWANVERSVVSTPGLSGGHLSNTQTNVRTLTVPVMVKSDDLQKTKEDMAKWLIHKGAKELIFKDEPDRVYYAVVDGSLDLDELFKVGIGTITFLCPDPHKYAKDEETHNVTSGITTLNNRGTAGARPIFELIAKENTTFAMLNNQFDEYMLLGFPLEEEGQEEIIDDRVSVLFEDGSTLGEWSTTNTKVDTNFIDTSGSMTSDGSGIRAQSYGTGNKMHGPAITRELPKALEDFEINTNFDIVSNRPEDNFRMEIYFLDDNMNMLGKVGIKDNNRADKKRMALGRVGAYEGGGESNGYVIGQHNYNRIVKTNTTLFNLSVKREGDLFTFYVGRWYNKKHQWIAKETYLDVAKEFSGKLKFVTIFIGNYKDRAVPSRLRVNNLEVFELKQLTTDQTPYILREGDELIIDHEEENIFINGVNAMPIKHFGSEFFELPSGYSTVTIEPSGAFEGTVRYKERYK